MGSHDENADGLKVAETPVKAPEGETSASAAKPVDKSEMTNLIDGKKLSAEIRNEVRIAVEELMEKHGLQPGLAVVVVGDRPDSATYVRMKKKAAAEVNFLSVSIELEESVSQKEIEDKIDELNARDDVHGILVQLPLPAHVDENAVLKRIKLEKDVDGFLAQNIGNLCLRGGDPPLALPCTPAGCVELLQRSGVECSGKHAVVVGRSNIVGMPAAQLLLSMDATVTVVHSKTKNIEEIVRMGDIVIAAVGRMEFIRGSWIKPGAVVIDVGINSKPDPKKKAGYRLVGDVAFDEVQPIAGLITPVPGGVGPMTIAMLCKNTLNLARLSIGLPRIPLRRGGSPNDY